MKNNDIEKSEIDNELESMEEISKIDIRFEQGKNFFKTNCGSCHASDMATDLTAPALGDVQARWEGREGNLYDWIRNSGKYLIENPNDKYAQNLYLKWDKHVMTAFPNLTDEEIENILTYIETIYNQ